MKPISRFGLKVNESKCKQCGTTPHFSTGQNLLKKIEKRWILTKSFSNGKNLLKKYWEKINIDLIDWEKVFDRCTDLK